MDASVRNCTVHDRIVGVRVGVGVSLERTRTGEHTMMSTYGQHRYSHVVYSVLHHIHTVVVCVLSHYRVCHRVFDLKFEFEQRSERHQRVCLRVILWHKPHIGNLNTYQNLTAPINDRTV